jgi:hypothetical protein
MTTNAPPEGAELTFVRSVMSKTSMRLENVERQISRLRDRLQQLEEECTSLSKYLAQNSASLSPLRRMPAEILGDIFFWSLPSLNTALGRPCFDINDCPWVLTHVSGRWRAVALSIPSLWSKITINYRKNPTYPLDAVKTQIRRTERLKIHFYGSEEFESRPQVEMFQHLAEHSSRWEDLDIILTSNLTSLLGSLRDRVPSLRRLWIQWQGRESQDGTDAVDVFQTAPSLLDAGIYNRFRHIHIPLPAHQLTRYDLDAPWTVHESILKLARNLVEVRIVLKFSQDVQGPSGVLYLSSLRRIYVSQASVLDRLVIPGLEKLAFYVGAGQAPSAQTHVESFLDRSSCPLRTLCLRGSPDTHLGAEILRKTPSILELGMFLTNASDEIDSLVSELTVNGVPGSSVIAPQLCYISVGCQNATYMDYAVYLKMLQSRWNKDGCALKRAALLRDSGPAPDRATLRGLEVLQENGLELSLLEGPAGRKDIRRWLCRSTWDI